MAAPAATPAEPLVRRVLLPQLYSRSDRVNELEVLLYAVRVYKNVHGFLSAIRVPPTSIHSTVTPCTVVEQCRTTTELDITDSTEVPYYGTFTILWNIVLRYHDVP